MTIELKYGEHGAIHLDLPTERLVVDGGAPRAIPLADPIAATVDALASPLDFPPLARAVIPGDRIAVAVGCGVPQVDKVIAGVVQALIEGGASAADVSLVLAPHAERAQPLATSSIPPELLNDLRISVHDPHDAGSLCYLAASKDGHPIYFNRRIFDADLVVPVGELRLERSFGYCGVHSGLFPGFSDEATRVRFRDPARVDRATKRKHQREETEEAAWLLGVQFVVQAAPGPGDSVLRVFAGATQAVETAGQAFCESSWRYNAPHRANLVIAAIEGGSRQTWDSFGRALFAASRCVAEGGAIVLCSELHGHAGAAFKQFAAWEGEPDALRKAIRRTRGEDVPQALLLAKVMQRAKVYLLSNLSEDEVEDLGIGHIAHEAEVQRLCQRHDSYIVIGNAQHAMIAVPSDL